MGAPLNFLSVTHLLRHYCARHSTKCVSNCRPRLYDEAHTRSSYVYFIGLPRFFFSFRRLTATSDKFHHRTGTFVNEFAYALHSRTFEQSRMRHRDCQLHLIHRQWRQLAAGLAPQPCASSGDLPYMASSAHRQLTSSGSALNASPTNESVSCQPLATFLHGKNDQGKTGCRLHGSPSTN
jgi:hypothetical protein